MFNQLKRQLQQHLWKRSTHRRQQRTFPKFIPAWIEPLEDRTLLSTTTFVNTFVVNTQNDTIDANPGDGIAEDASGDTSLRAAIMEANALGSPTLIDLKYGPFVIRRGGINEDAGASGDLDVTGNITIQGDPEFNTVIDGYGLDRLFDVQYVRQSHTDTVDGETITYTANRDSNALSISIKYVDAELHTDHSWVSSVTDDGSGNVTIWIELKDNGVGESNATIDDVVAAVQSNVSARNYVTVTGTGSTGYIQTSQGGTLAWADGKNQPQLSLSHITLYRGGADFGGAIYSQGTVSMTDCQLYHNQASQMGGAIYNDSGSLTIENSEFRFNVSANDGGAIYNQGASADAVLRNVLFERNAVASNGGAIYNNGTMLVESTEITLQDWYKPNGFRPLRGGGIFNDGTLNLVSSRVIENNATGTGGGIHNSGALTIIDSVISNNNSQFGGGICNVGELSVLSSVFWRNIASYYGGAIDNCGGELEAKSTTFQTNKSSYGAALRNHAGTMTLFDCNLL